MYDVFKQTIGLSFNLPYITPQESHIYRPLANRSCHFPRAIVAGAVALPVSGTSSIVSWTVAMAFRPISGKGQDVLSVEEEEEEEAAGERRMSALEVFFCRRE